MYTDDIITQKKLGHIAGNHIFQENHGTDILFHRRNLDDSLKNCRNLDGGKLQFCIFFVLFLQQRPKVQRLVHDQRKWTGRIHRHRRQNRIHIFHKILVYIPCLFFVQFFMTFDHLKPTLAKSRQQGTLPGRILCADKLMHSVVNSIQLLLGRHPGNSFFAIFCIYHIL